MRELGLMTVALGAVLGTGCISSPAWEYGSTAKAKELDVAACGAGSIIEDGEDFDSKDFGHKGNVLEGRGGNWFSFVDANGSTITPAGWPFKMGAPGRNGSRGAPRMSGTMASTGDAVYAGMGIWLTDPTGPYDASKYTGVTFWAKGPGRVRFEIPDVHTGPEGGICKDCYNDFGIVLALEPDWRKYTIRFEWLEQRSGWGEPYPALQVDQILKLEWEFNGAGRPYDIVIDDIAFVCEGCTP
jgi:endoglucanase